MLTNALSNDTCNVTRAQLRFLPDRPELYHELVTMACDMQGYFSVVLRDAPTHGQEQFLRQSEFGLHGVMQSRCWPGTRLLEHEAEVRFYRANSSTIKTFLGTDTFLRWMPPSLPEDLCIWTPDLQWLVGSTAHEKDVFTNVLQQAHPLFEILRLRLDRLGVVPIPFAEYHADDSTS